MDVIAAIGLDNTNEVYKGKYLFLEFLRIFASFWVIYNHTGSYGYSHYLSEYGLLRWIDLFLSCLCKISVPLFLMISGAILLGKEEPISALFYKRVSRILELILVVCIAQYLYWGTLRSYEFSITHFLEKALFSYEICTYYLWLYLGLLLTLPALRLIAKRRDVICYLCILALVFMVIIPLMVYKLNLGAFVMNDYTPIFCSIYIYPLIGYYINTLSEEHFSRKNLIILAVAAILAILLSMAIKQEYALEYHTEFTSFEGVLGGVAAIFVFYALKFMFRKIAFPIWVKNAILIIAPTSLGVFLLSSILMWKIIKIYQILAAIMPSFIATLVWTYISMVVCQAITLLLRVFPPFRKIL